MTAKVIIIQRERERANEPMKLLDQMINDPVVTWSCVQVKRQSQSRKWLHQLSVLIVPQKAKLFSLCWNFLLFFSVFTMNWGNNYPAVNLNKNNIMTIFHIRVNGGKNYI